MVNSTHLSISEDIQNQYKTQFVSFGVILRHTLDLARDQFVHLFVIPTLWKILVVALPLIIISLTFFAKISSQIDYTALLKGWRSLLDNGDSAPIDQLSSWLNQNFAVPTFALIFAFGFFGVVFMLLDYRTIYLYNDDQVTSIWKTPRSFYATLYRISLIWIGLSILTSSITEAFGQTSAAALIANFIPLIFSSLFGLFEYLIIFEDEFTVSSLAISYRYSIPYFWQNILRWTKLGIIALVTLIGILIATAIWLKPLERSGYSPAMIAIFCFMLLISLVCTMIMSYVYDVFGYLSYMNLKLLAENKKSIQ